MIETTVRDDSAAEPHEALTGYLKRKPVYLGDVAIGSACTWYEVATALESALGRTVTVRSLLNRSSEGPDGFFVSTCQHDEAWFRLRAPKVSQILETDMHRILLVEDDPDVGPLLENMLLSAGYRVSKVETVSAARLLLDHHAHDLLLTDVNLPDGDGIDVADRAKGKGVRTILVTGYAFQLPPEELRRHEYLMKPVRSAELVAAVKRVLGSSAT